MIQLVIDTCTSNVVISLLKDGKELGKIVQRNDNDLSGKFTSLVNFLFNENKIMPKDVDTIFVAVGPGSFTGIRIGVTFAKVMAYTLNKKIIPFYSLELMATEDSKADIVVPLIDARRGYVYAGGYDNKLNNIFPEQYILIDELMEKLVDYSSVKFVSYDKFTFNTDIPNIDVEKLVEKHIDDEGINPHSVNPCYLKKTEAETKLCGE